MGTNKTPTGMTIRIKFRSRKGAAPEELPSRLQNQSRHETAVEKGVIIQHYDNTSPTHFP